MATAWAGLQLRREQDEAQQLSNQAVLPAPQRQAHQVQSMGMSSSSPLQPAAMQPAGRGRFAGHRAELWAAIAQSAGCIERLGYRSLECRSTMTSA